MAPQQGDNHIAQVSPRSIEPIKPLAVLFVLFVLVSPLSPLLSGGTGTVSAESLPVWTRVLHLHDGFEYEAGRYDWMNSTDPYNPPYMDYDGDGHEGITIRKNLPSQRWDHHWVLYPASEPGLTLTGDLSAYLWAKSRDNASGSLMTAIFFDAPPDQFSTPELGTEIGRVTIPMQGPVFSKFRLYNFTVPDVSYTVSAGNHLVMTVQRGDSLNDGLIVHFDKTDYDSYIVLRTSTFISVDALHSEDALGVPRSFFSDSESVTVEANVSNPFGAYDIVAARASVAYQDNGTVLYPPGIMAEVASGPSPTPYWKVFNITFDNLPSASFVVNVSAFDPQGSPSWMTIAITVVTVHNFELVVPSIVTVDQQFSMTVSAMNETGAVIPNWAGTVELLAYKSDMVSLGEGGLSIASIAFTPADFGQVTVNDQTYNFSEELVRIQASSGSHEGWSDVIDVRSGPVVLINVDPPGPIELNSSESRLLTAEGRDAGGRVNTTWIPYWHMGSTIGTIDGSGLSVTFTGRSAGTDEVICQNNETGASRSVFVTVAAGELHSIVINSPSSPLQIREGLSQLLTATGYDEYGNEVDISGARWDTSTSGTVEGAGASAVYTAGYIPETGEINVRLGGLIGTLEVVVRESVYGPWLSPIPVQIKNEDAGSWTLSLTGYWHDVNGTAGLVWRTEGVNTSLYFVSHDADSNALMLFFTQPDKHGEDEFALWVVDPTGFWTFQVVTVRVLPLNDRPMFVNDPPVELYVRFETPYTFDYRYYVYDVDNPKSELTLVLADPQPTRGLISFDGLIATFIFERGTNGAGYFEFVYIELRDLIDHSSLTLVIRVTDDYPPSMLKDLPDLEMNEGDVMFFAFDLDDYFFDLDVDDVLVYTYGFEHLEIWIDHVTNEVYINATEEWSGVTEGTFTAKDPTGALKVDTIQVTVWPVNDAPRAIKPIGTIVVRYDTVYVLPLKNYIYDPDNSMDTLTFSINCSYVSYTWTFMGSHQLELLFPANLSGPSYTEPYLVHVGMTVSDPEPLSVVSNFVVRVTNNFPPEVIASDPDQIYYSFQEDGYLNNSLRMYDLFSDQDDDSLSFMFSGLSHIKAKLYSNGVVNLTADVNWSGTETLDIMAIDGGLGWASIVAYVTVTEVNDAPVISSIPDQIVRGGPRNSNYFIKMFVTDSDNDYSDLTFIASPSEHVAVVGEYLYFSLPDGVDVITVTLRAGDGELESNTMTFKVGVSKTMAERIGYPYSLPLVLLAAAVGAYFLSLRLPRPSSLENLFLIHNDGRLIHHVTREENTLLDKDVLSAMFTAVQEFVKDSFQKGEVGLKKLEIGDKNVLIEKGKSVYLAMIYSGWPSKEVFRNLSMLLRDIEERYEGRLEKWNGTMKSVKGVDKMLQDFMGKAFKPGVWHEEPEIAEEEWVDLIDKEA